MLADEHMSLMRMYLQTFTKSVLKGITRMQQQVPLLFSHARVHEIFVNALFQLAQPVAESLIRPPGVFRFMPFF